MEVIKYGNKIVDYTVDKVSTNLKCIGSHLSHFQKPSSDIIKEMFIIETVGIFGMNNGLMAIVSKPFGSAINGCDKISSDIVCTLST